MLIEVDKTVSYPYQNGTYYGSHEVREKEIQLAREPKKRSWFVIPN